MRTPLSASRRERSQDDAAPIEALPLARCFVLCLAFLLVALPLVARADDDLPGRVGRIAEFAGQLYLSPQEQATEWEAVGLNYPVITGDNLWVSGDGRAEVDYGGGQFRIAGDTSLHVSRLDDRQLALFVAQGRLVVRVRVLEPGDATLVDTPNTQVTLMRPGLYRIDVTPDRQQTTVTVREGEAVIALANGAQQALPGQSATVSGPDPADAFISSSTGIDGFDAWSAERDRRYERARSTAYVSRQMVGYADLDEYGSWQTYPEYGAVWFPTSVAAGWAPYQDGYWANVGGWGYTWVDSAPWGYAPFHYGRWMSIGGRWGWCPGAYVARPVWAPALVGWFGGAGWGLSLNVGGPVYGWVPLGWGEPYLPWWKRCSYNCWTHYNRPYNVNVAVRQVKPPPHYRNVNVPGAVSAVAATTIRDRRPIATNLVPVPATLATSAPVMASTPAVAPGPAPGPRPRPGVGSTPPPASSFVPPSRAGFAGARDGSRGRGPEPAPAGGAAPGTAVQGPAVGTQAPSAGPQRPGGGRPPPQGGIAAPQQRGGAPAVSEPRTPVAAPKPAPGAATGTPPQPADTSAPRPSQRRPHEVPATPGATGAPSEAPPTAPGSPTATPEGRAAPGRAQSQPARAREGQAPANIPAGGGSATPLPPARQPVQSGAASSAAPMPSGKASVQSGAAPSTAPTPSDGRAQPYSRRPPPTPQQSAPMAPAGGAAPPHSGAQGGAVPIPAPRGGPSAPPTANPPAAVPSAPPQGPDNVRSVPRGDASNRPGRGSEKGDANPNPAAPQGNLGR